MKFPLNIFSAKNSVKGFSQVELLVVILATGIVPSLITSVASIYYRPVLKLSSHPVVQVSQLPPSSDINL